MNHKIMNLSDLSSKHSSPSVRKEQRIFNLSPRYWITIDDIDNKLADGLIPYEKFNGDLIEIENPFEYERGQKDEFVNLKNAVWLTPESAEKVKEISKDFRVAKVKMKRIAEFGKVLPTIKKLDNA